METDLNILIPENIRLISFNENTITVLLKGDTEVVFKFKDREQMGKALDAWARKPSVSRQLSSEVTLRLPADSRQGQIYPTA